MSDSNNTWPEMTAIQNWYSATEVEIPHSDLFELACQVSRYRRSVEGQLAKANASLRERVEEIMQLRQELREVTQ